MEVLKAKKEFYELTGLDTTKEDWEEEGFRVINFSMVKKEYLKVIDNIELANRFHLFNPMKEVEEEELKKLYDHFETIVFKESRGGIRDGIAIGWENINSYLDWHSCIFLKWFRNGM
jgi:hypothetical protein